MEARQYDFPFYTKCRTVTSYDTKCGGYAELTVRQKPGVNLISLSIRCTECDIIYCGTIQGIGFDNKNVYHLLKKHILKNFTIRK